MTESHPTSILWPIVVGAAIILANAFFVLFEFAIVTVRRGQIEHLAEMGNRNAGLISHMLRDPDWAIAGSQVGITMASVLLGVVAEEPLRLLLSPILAQLFGQSTVPRAPVHRAGNDTDFFAAVVHPDGDR